MTLPKLSPSEAQRLAQAGARLIDIRGRDEFARARAAGAENRPLDELGAVESDAPVVFLCRSGMRTSGNAAKLAACCGGEAYILDGGLAGAARRGARVRVEPAAVRPVRLRRRGTGDGRHDRLVRHGAAARGDAVEPARGVKWGARLS